MAHKFHAGGALGSTAGAEETFVAVESADGEDNEASGTVFCSTALAYPFIIPLNGVPVLYRESASSRATCCCASVSRRAASQ